MNLGLALHRNAFANSLVKTMRINRVIDAYLARFPIRRRTPSGLVYWQESVPSMVVANEIFSTDLYAGPVATVRPSTFVDLGANVGYFPLLIAEVLKSRAIRGLCVEPNPYLHALIESHLTSNELRSVRLIKGLVKGPPCEAEADFFLNPSHIASSANGRFNPRVPVGGRVRTIKVPVVDLSREWRLHFGDERVDLLKIDIEGGEIEFLESHFEFLERVRTVLIEWHAWVTTLEEVSNILRRSGFELESVCHVDEHAGTAFFRDSRTDEPAAGSLRNSPRDEGPISGPSSSISPPI
jgi:FkbM family methyltransferase